MPRRITGAMALPRHKEYISVADNINWRKIHRARTGNTLQQYIMQQAHLRRAHGISWVVHSGISTQRRSRQARYAGPAHSYGLVGMLQRPLGVLQELQRQRHLVVRLSDAPVIPLRQNRTL